MSQTNNPELNNNSSSIMSDIQPNLPQLVEELQSIRATWRLFGLFLGIPKEELEAIDEDKRNVGDKLYVLCYKWLQMKPRGTWKDIVTALKKIKALHLAESLEEKYIKHDLPSSDTESAVISSPGDNTEITHVDVQNPHRPTFHQLYEELCHVKAKWERFGICLGFVPDELAVIARSKPDLDQSFAAVCDEWLKRNPSGAWEDIIIALEKMKQFDLKTELEKKYIKHHLPSSDTSHGRSYQIPTSPSSLPYSQNVIHVEGTPLMRAASTGNVLALHALLQSNVDPNEANDGFTALYAACQNRHYQCVDLLLQSKADPDIQANDGATALFIASKYGRDKCVDLLLQSKANPNIQTNNGATALHTASENKHHQCVDLLLQSKADPDIQANNGATALYIASQNGDHHCVDLLLQSKAKTDIKCNNGITALSIASHNGHHQCVDLLLQSKADPNIQENSGITALYIASLYGHHQCVDLLLRSDANPNIQANNGATALLMASQNGHDQCVDLLLQSKANPNILNKDGFTPLRAAILNKHHHIVNMLLEHNADANIEVQSPLYVACGIGDLSLVSLLLQHGALIDTPGGISPLTLAVKMGHYDIAKSLINAGANVNIQEQYVEGLCGITPLMAASTHGNLPMVQLLLQSGAEVMIQDKEGYTAYDAAKAYQHQKIITLLTIKIFEQAQKYSLQSEECHESASPQQHQDNNERQTQESSLETIRNHFNSIMLD